MISIIFALKLGLLFAILGMIAVSFFHSRETTNMENRLGILLPTKIKFASKIHLYSTVILLTFLSLLFLF